MTRTSTMTSNIFDIFGAIMADNLAAVQTFLQQSDIDLNQMFRGSTPTSLAYYQGKETIFNYLLNNADTQSKLDLNLISSDGIGRFETLLTASSRLGDESTAKLLLSKGADVNAVDNFNHTALWTAARHKQNSIAQLLIDSGAKINLYTKWNENPLYLAYKYPRREDMAILLILNGSDISCSGESKTKTLLHWALFHCHKTSIKILAYSGYNITRERALWLVLPSPLAKDTDFCTWLKEELSQPPSLLRQCRVAIRKRISSIDNGSYFSQKIRKLPLPNRLLSFVAMSEFDSNKH